MGMATSYHNAIATAGGAVITHVGLVNEAGTEISGGTYARQPVSWAAVSNGQLRLAGDEVFNVPAGVTVGGWRGFTALTSGTNHGGQDFAVENREVFTNAGTYTLTATATGINHTAAA